jgi:hypothetical protein
VKTAADAEQPRKDAGHSISEATLAYVAAESRKSFFYGLVSSPICFGLAGAVFLLVQRRRRTANTTSVHGIDETVLH